MTPLAPPVTVIIPVGPRHADLAQRAVDSVGRQQVPCKVIVANDTRNGDFAESIFSSGNITEALVVDVTDVPEDYSGGQRASRARNMALTLVDTPWVVFLDGDDELTDDSIEVMLRIPEVMDGVGYVYGDTLQVRETKGGGYKEEIVRSRAYSFDLLGKVNIHPVTALVPSGIAKELGFDEGMGEWEDWVFYLDLARHGYCGTKVDHPVFKYYMDAGANRMRGFTIQRELYRRVQRNYLPSIRRAIKDNTMCGCSSPTSGGTGMSPTNLQRNTRAMDSALVPLMYKGINQAARGFQVGETIYRVRAGQILMVHPDHVDSLLARGNGTLFARQTEARPTQRQSKPAEPTAKAEVKQGALVEAAKPAEPTASATANLSARRKPRPDGAPQAPIEIEAQANESESE